MSALERLLSKYSVNDERGCWEWSGYKNKCGYGVIKINGRAVLAHRASFELQRGDIPSGLQVLHRCDNPSCINLKHLFLGTQVDNMADRSVKGRQSRGITHARAKLSEADVIAIRASVGDSDLKLAARYGVSAAQIYRVRLGMAWTHIKVGPEHGVASASNLTAGEDHGNRTQLQRSA